MHASKLEFFPPKWWGLSYSFFLISVLLGSNLFKWLIVSAVHQVKFRQGTEMLNIFKNYSSKTSIFDDFEFYESRQKAMQDKRMMQFAPRLEHYQVISFLYCIYPKLYLNLFSQFIISCLSSCYYYHVYFCLSKLFILFSFINVFYTADCRNCRNLPVVSEIHFRLQN